MFPVTRRLNGAALATFQRTGSVPCPRCGAALVCEERRRVDGQEYCYLNPCPTGCGVFVVNLAIGQLRLLFE